MSRNPLPPHLRRIAVACAVAACLLLFPRPASGGVLWDIGAGIGYAALICALALYVYPLRGEGLPHRRLFTLSQHRRIGWIALALGGAHATLLLVTQPLTGHYLLPSAPLYMLCGVAALVALAALVATGLTARSALRKTHSAAPSIATHAILAATLLALMGAHILGSAQLVDLPTKAFTACLLLAIPLAWTALRPRPGRRHARLLSTVIPCCLAALSLLVLPIPTATSHLMQPATTPSTLHVYFPHEAHTTVNCATCHHNFLDKTGVGSCLDCHRSARTDLVQSAEATFHLFCRDCHRQLSLEHKKHGVVRSCSGCHIR